MYRGRRFDGVMLIIVDGVLIPGKGLCGSTIEMGLGGSGSATWGHG